MSFHTYKYISFPFSGYLLQMSLFILVYTYEDHGQHDDNHLFTNFYSSES